MLGAAVKKHSAHDQYFCAIDDYVLLFPDHKIANQIPGSNETFTVEGYKKELSKAYSKVNLFICSQNTFTSAHQSQETSYQKNPPHQPDMISTAEEEQFLTPLQPLVNFPNLRTDPDTIPDDDFLDSPPWSWGLHLEAPPSTSHQVVASSATNVKRTEAKVHCPICNKKYCVSIIEEHASICLESRESPFMAIDDSHNEDYYVQEDFHQELEKDVAERSASECNHLLSQVLKEADVDRSNDVQVHVRRGHALDDFKHFFRKPWNKKKQHCQYRITFIGEAGIDSGGLSREFYSGNVVISSPH